MKALALVVLVACVAGCSRSDRWSVAAVQELSDQDYRRLRVELVTRDSVPWPLKLSVSAVDSVKKRIESTLPRWTARKVGPNTVAFEFAEAISGQTKPFVLDLKIAAPAHSNLCVHLVFGDR